MADTHISETAPTKEAHLVKRGDFWLTPSTAILKICLAVDPVVVYSAAIGSGLGAPVVTVTNVTTADGDATYGQPEADLMNEIKADLNILLAALRAKGIIA